MAMDRYLEPYRQSAAQHGPGFEATLWSNERAQRLRFEVFTQMYDLAGKRVLDAGCSNGYFAQYLMQQQIEFSDYIGVDGVDQVIVFAQSRRLARCEFVAGDFLADPTLLARGDPDVICISGTLNTMTDEQATAVLESAWSAVGDALLFNFLPNLAGCGAPSQTGPARRLDALHLIRWATGETGGVTYRQDYFRHGHDATILMTKS